MLWYKAWLETRFRFLIGAVMILGLCAFFVIGNPLILWQWNEDLRLRPELYNPPWLFRAMEDYPFFIWHFLFQDMLQKLWVLFAVLLGFGGISRESAQGTAGFTLSLPVSRARLLNVRTATGFLEIVFLGLIPAAAIPLLSLIIGKPYPILHGLAHSLFLIAGGSVFYAMAVFLSALIRDEYTPALIGISVAAIMFFLANPYLDGAEQPLFLKLIDVTRVMSGISAAVNLNFPLLSGLVVSLALASTLFILSRKIVGAADY